MPFITADRDQMGVLGYSLSDLVEKDAKCRFVLALVERLDLRPLYARYSRRGAEAFDPAMMLACWFYANSEGVSSSRQLEERCRRDTHFIYLSAHVKPDHTSFARFRKNHLDMMADYFVQLVRLAQQERVADFGAVALDGTRVQASASPKAMCDEAGLNRRLRAIRDDIAFYMKACEEADAADDAKETDAADTTDETEGASKRELARKELARKKKEEVRLVKRQKQLADRKQTLKAEHRRRHKINLVEPDACVLDKVNGHRRLPAYNAQFVVDTRTHLIGACDTVDERNDQRLFARMHRLLEDTLETGAAVRLQRRWVCDAGYHSLDQLAYIDAEGLDVVVADPTPEHRSKRPGQTAAHDAAHDASPSSKTSPSQNAPSQNAPSQNAPSQAEPGARFKRRDFVFDPETDSYVCPAGEVLSRQQTRTVRGRRKQVYKGAPCQKCALKPRCQPRDHLVRSIHRDEAEHLAEAMDRRLQSEEAARRLKARRETVEPVIGNVKANLGFRRFRLRGLDQAKGELCLMAIAHNINKLFALAQSGRLLADWARLLFFLRWHTMQRHAVTKGPSTW